MTSTPPPTEDHPRGTDWEYVLLLDEDFDEIQQQELAYRRWRERIDVKLEREQ